MTRFWKTVLMICGIYLATALIIEPIECVEAGRDAIELCLNVVIPSLFPFLICSNLLISFGFANYLSKGLSGVTRYMFGVSGGGTLAIILGIVSGYPIGAACIAGLYSGGSCTKKEAERLLTFCNNSGPLFVLGAVGAGMFHSREVGVFLYLVHIISAMITGVIFRRYGGSDERKSPLYLPSARESDITLAVGNSIADGVTAIGKICGFVIFFAVFCRALPHSFISPFLHGFLEITGGIYDIINEANLKDILLFPAVSACLALSGVSVLLQTAGIVCPAGLSIKPYILGKITQSAIAFTLALIFQKIFPIAEPTFSGGWVLTPLGVIEWVLFGLSVLGISIFIWTLGIWLFLRNKK